MVEFSGGEVSGVDDGKIVIVELIPVRGFEITFFAGDVVKFRTGQRNQGGKEDPGRV